MNDLIIENIHETKNYNLLKDVYNNILKPCFPNPEDHLNWTKMKAMAKNGIENLQENGKVLISVSKKNDLPVSFFVGIYYKKSQTGLVSYMGIKDGRKGLSASNIQKQVLIEMEKEAKNNFQILRGVFSLVDLPEHADPKYITLPPLQRIIIMERNGASHIPIDFHYPMFKRGLMSLIRPRVKYKNDAALLGYKLNGKLSTENPEVIKDFLDDFYASYGINILDNHLIHKMKNEINRIDIGEDIKLSRKYNPRYQKPKITSNNTHHHIPHKTDALLHKKILQK